MFSDIRALHAIYPLLPDGTIYKNATSERYERAKCIRDAFVHVDLGPMDALDGVESHGVSCVLRSIRTSDDGVSRIASVSVLCAEYGIGSIEDTGTSYDIPICTNKDEYKYTYDEYTGSNSTAHLVHGYIVADDRITDGDVGLYIHPDCVVVSQRPPSLYALYDANLYKSGEHAGPQQLVGLDKLADVWFVDGNNASASLSSGGVTVSLSAGAGMGIYNAPPFIDVEEEDIDLIGITSLNGLSGDVSIIGESSVLVDVSALEKGVRVELSLNETKQEE